MASYAVIDRLVQQLANRSAFPALTDIRLAGHSAGGQVMVRHALATHLWQQTVPARIRHVVANPSSYPVQIESKQRRRTRRRRRRRRKEEKKE